MVGRVAAVSSAAVATRVAADPGVAEEITVIDAVAAVGNCVDGNASDDVTVSSVNEYSAASVGDYTDIVEMGNRGTAASKRIDVLPDEAVGIGS